MQIGNVRLGHATNSSSTHSIIILPEGESAPSGDYAEAGEYGWNWFVLGDKHRKFEYLAAAVGHVLVKKYGVDLAFTIMREWFPTSRWNENWYIDHQSELSFPVDAVTDQVSKEFVADFKTFLEREDVVVLGGNDNSYDTGRFEGAREHEINTGAIDGRGDTLRAAKSGNWWTLYNPDTGAKVRFSFNENALPLERSSVPELVDLKITNYCPFECKFCYQDSTSGGKHAKFEDIKSYIRALSKSGVFEVAIGGGEPTYHPEFIEVLKYAHSMHVTPNFTTKRLPSFWSAELVAAVKEYAGAVAVSVEYYTDIEKLAAFATLHELKGRIVAQFVVGTQNDYGLKYTIDAAKEQYIPLTLLGYKRVGRAKELAPKKQYVTAELLQRAWRLSVDTAFVDQYANVIKEAGVHEDLVVVGEGRFSMYMDAVTHQAGISSYHTESFREYFPDWNGMGTIWEEIGACI